jgi:hypothetical protein
MVALIRVRGVGGGKQRRRYDQLSFLTVSAEEKYIEKNPGT